MSKSIKYASVHKNAPLPIALLTDAKYMHKLDNLRTELVDQAFMGLDSLGANVGNVSFRVPNHLQTHNLTLDSKQEDNCTHETSVEFVISGSGTGKHRVLGEQGYALVTKACNASNTVESQGCVPPSSESLSHAAVYAACPHVNVVVHGHHAGVYAWGIAGNAPYTAMELLYGTPAMAEAIIGLVAGQNEGFFIMLGHEDGFFVYGYDSTSVENYCKKLFRLAKEIDNSF